MFPGGDAKIDVCPLADLPTAALVTDDVGIVLLAHVLCEVLFGRDVTSLPLTAVVTEGPPDGGDGSAHWRTEATSPDGVPFLVDADARRRADGTSIVVLRQVGEALVLRESLQQLDAAFALAPIGMAFFDTDGRYVRVNPALCTLLGRSAEDLIGRRDSELTHPEDRQSDVDAAWRILRGEIDAWQTEKRFVRPDGEVVWAIANLTFLRDEDRRPLTWLGQFQDITARKTLERRLRELAEEDPLTGLANRRRLDAALRDAIALAGRYGHGGALIYVDLDGFKAVNDTFGHDTGDALLQGAAQAMRERCRTTDTVARVGGDEFAVPLPVATAAEARAVQEGLARVLDAVTTTAGRGGQVKLAATMGMCWFGPHDERTPAGIIAAADRAMYRARSTD